MKIATLANTNVQVEIIAVNGGWTTVRDVQTDKTFKVRNGSIGKVTEITEPQTLKAAKAKTSRAKAEPKAPRERVPLEQRKNGKVDALYLQFYQNVVVDRGGVKVRSMDKGDEVALELRAKTLPEVYDYAAQVLGETMQDLVARFKHLNPGMQRMNLGNMIRRINRAGAK